MVTKLVSLIYRFENSGMSEMKAGVFIDKSKDDSSFRQIDKIPNHIFGHFTILLK